MSTPLRAATPGELAPGLFRDIAEQWPGAVVVVNRDGVVRWLNDAAGEWVAGEPGAALGTALEGLALPWLQEPGDLRAVLKGGARQFAARVAVDRRGRERFCSARLVPLRRRNAVCGAMLFIDDVATAEGSTVVQAPSITDAARAVALGAAQVGAWHRHLQTGEGGVDALWCAALRLDPCTGPDHHSRWEKLIHPDDVAEFRARNDELAQGDSASFEVEFRVLTEDSRWLWLLQRGQAIEHDDAGRPLRAAGICIEIDARKRAEVALQEKESRLATALWGARAAFWHWNITTDVSVLSSMWFAMTGYQREEWEREANPWHSRLHPEDAERVERAIRDHFEGRAQSLEFEYRIRLASGEYRWMQDRGRVSEWDFQGNPTVAIGVSLDVEAQKQAELELRSSEARLETAVWGARIGLWELDFATEQTRWHSDWCQQMDIDPCDGADHVERWDASIHPDDAAEAQRSFAAHVAGHADHYDAEYRIRTRGGEWRWLFERGRVVARAPDGAPLRMVGVCMDIEERTVAERDAHDVRERLERAIDVARIGIWDWDVPGERFYCNDRYSQNLGTEAETQDFHERRTAWLEHMHPDDRPPVLAMEREIMSGAREEFESEYRLRNASGEYRWTLERGRVTARAADGTPARMSGFMVDITKRRDLELARAQAVATLHVVTEHAPDHLMLLDRDLCIRFVNRGWAPFEPADLLGHRIVEFLSEPNQRALSELYVGVLATGEPGQLEVEQTRTSGDALRLVHRVSAVREKGVITGLSLAVTDNTARHRAEERSRATESVLHTIAEVTSDWLVMLDANLRFVFINRSFGGHAPREIIGRSLSDLSPRQVTGRVRELAESVLRSGKPRTEEQDFTAPDGTQRRFELRVRPVHGATAGAGAERGVVITATDITARKVLEREILEIANREQLRMGGDLHDGLSQDLTGIALMLRGVAGQLRKERSEARADVEEVIGLVNAAIESTRVLASGLSPVNGGRGGLVAALESLAARMQDRHGVNVEIATRLETPLVLADGALNHLYRIAQEAVINAIRHGYPKRVGIDLAQEGERIRLRVVDDGRGFGPGAASSTGLGLRIMRYRARMLDGELTVEPNGAKGLRVECICPVASSPRADAS